MQTFTISGKPPVTGNITDRVKSFEDACNVLGIQEGELSLSGYLLPEFKTMVAYAKLIIIARALNEGWIPNWKDDSQYKYYPWFDLSSGSGLRYRDYVGLYSSSAVGSRLCFKSRELAEYAGNQFLSIYTDFFII